MPFPIRPTTLLVVTMLLAGCGPREARPGAGGAPSPGAALTALESRLLVTDTLAIRYVVLAEGAFTARIEGELVLAGDSVWLAGAGRFGADSVMLALATSNGRMRGGNGDRAFDEAIPAALREALIVGMVRMGVLHNLARLTAGRPPDRADGGVGDWVRAVEPVWSPAPGAAGGDPGGIRFDIVVDGRAAGEAVLWLGPDGLPLTRVQTVRFPNGTMTVREDYVLGERGRP